ncbi:kinetochore-associated protein NSL1 homolog [Rana temporaria]|uniref:kinetochore-associated protein NSL1 homolog n=1 Tax=Rana temporaria TaxID=8407 RepID=UPI001AAD342B|nr:kinetochore-associated protein NSL1 homolog [Rana temporaria]
MAANVDSPKRRSLRSQDTKVDAENGPASSTSGARGPAVPRTSGNAKSLSAEKRRAGTERKEGSLGKRRSEEILRRKQHPIKGTPQGKNETDQEPNNRAPSTGRKEKRDSKSAHPKGPNAAESAHPKGPNAAESAHPKGPNAAESAHPKGPNAAESAHPKVPNAADRVPSMEPKSASHSPGGDDVRSLRSRRSQDSPSVNIADNPQGATSSPATNASLNRETRSSKAKSQEQPEASAAVRGLGEGAISSKDKARLAEPSSEKTQGSEGPVESSGHGSSLRPRRSRDGSSINGENSSRGAAAVTSASLKRETRSSAGRKQEGSEAIMGKGAISSKEIMENEDLVEPNSQKQENPDESSSRNRSLQSTRSREGSGFNAEDDHKGATPSTVTRTLSNRKTRARKTKDFEEPGVSIAVSGGGDGLDSSQQNENQAKANSQHGKGSEDPGGSSGHNRSSQPKGNLSSTNVNVEDSSRAAALSTGTNASFTRETRSSKAIDFQEEKGSGDFGGRSSHNRSLQRQRSPEVSSSNVQNSSRGPSSSTERCDLISGDATGQKIYEKAGLSTAANKSDSDTLLSKGDRVMRPSNQSEETLDISGGVRSPGKNLRPRRSCDGSGISGGNSEAIRGGDGTPSKERTGKSEPITQSGDVLGNPRGHISPRKNVTKNKNLEDPVDERHPSNLTMESNAGEAARDYKVHCCSKQLLQEMLGMCTGICKEIVDSQQYLNEEQKQQHHKNLVWDFESAFQENVSINGRSWHEAPDKDSEPDIKILEDQLDEAIVETSMKRKRYPRKILSHFVKALKTEREILNQYKPVVNPEKVRLDPALELRMKDLSATTATVCHHIHETKKALPVQLKKAEGFCEVLSLQPVLEESHIRKDIFYSRVVIEDISKSIPKILDTTPTESEPQDLATPVRSLRKRKISLPQRHLYPLQSKRKISLES